MTKMNDDGGLIGMRTEDLRVQALKNPLGINENPVFSWQLVSDKKDEKNERQTAYRILVSESEASLINETGMLWDSGVVKESRCFGILYQGKKLHSAPHPNHSPIFCP